MFDIDNLFDHHAPDAGAVQQHEQYRAECKRLAGAIDNLPPGREQSLAMTNLEQALFWGNAAIARS